MLPATNLRCDGCGQPATAEHTARRLKRLEWTTRYRPVHIGTLFLGASSPAADAEFLYAESFPFAGEAARLLYATGVRGDGKSAEATLVEFQRRGFLLAHMLECPLETVVGDPTSLLREHFDVVAARIRRSLKPKKIVLISGLLEPLLGQFEAGRFGCPILLDGGRPFALDADPASPAVAMLAEALGLAAGGG